MNLADPTQCGSVATAVQPAAAYELLANIVLLGVMLYLASRLRRPGLLLLVYLFGYVITQFSLFFVRDNTIVSFLGLNWGLKQAQWTSLVVFILLIPLTFLILRVSKPIPVGEVPATYGIPQKSARDTEEHEPVMQADGNDEQSAVEETAPKNGSSPAIKEASKKIES